MRNVIKSVVNYFTDKPQEKEPIFKPLAKLEEKDPQPSLFKYFKNLTIQRRASFMHNELLTIMLEMIDWVHQEFGFIPVITETVTLVEEDKVAGRKSSSHQEGRAFDMRTRGWEPQQIKQFQEHFNAKYGHMGAISLRSGKPNFIFHHDVGTGPHFHVQLNGSYAVASLQNTIRVLESKV